MKSYGSESGVSVGRGVDVTEGVKVGEGVTVGVGVCVGVGLNVAVAVGSGVSVGSGVAVSVGVGGEVGVGVGVEAAPHAVQSVRYRCTPVDGGTTGVVTTIPNEVNPTYRPSREKVTLSMSEFGMLPQSGDRDASDSTPVDVSRTYTSSVPFVSSGTRPGWVRNAMSRPSSLTRAKLSQSSE